MKTFQYRPQGVCSRNIMIELDDDNVIRSLQFEGGCHGNLQGISKLAVGRKAEEVAACLSGTRCREKPTSCPDQLSKALRSMLESKAQ